MLRFADTMKKHGVKPESEIYEAGVVNNVKVFHQIGAIDLPLHFQFVLGVLGGMQATPGEPGIPQEFIASMFNMFSLCWGS